MQLPAALAPWGPALRIFPLDLALALGPWLQRLDAAMGPLRNRLQPGDGEVDGFDDLARKGSYERLLATEWLLTEEAPEEFLRRAATGEHLFLRLSRPRPAGSRCSVALFDAGPGQLGSPRLAQIAALIVLARRAEAADALFNWGILQEPDRPLKTGVAQADVLHLLGARTPHEATEGHWKEWQDRLRAWSDLDDAWIVGGTRPGSRPPLAISRLEIRDEIDPRTQRVAAAVHRRGMRGPEILLELPEDSLCARLLRDPMVEPSPRAFRPVGLDLPPVAARRPLVASAAPHSPPPPAARRGESGRGPGADLSSRHSPDAGLADRCR